MSLTTAKTQQDSQTIDNTVKVSAREVFPRDGDRVESERERERELMQMEMEMQMDRKIEREMEKR